MNKEKEKITIAEAILSAISMALIIEFIIGVYFIVKKIIWPQEVAIKSTLEVVVFSIITTFALGILVYEINKPKNNNNER